MDRMALLRAAQRRMETVPERIKRIYKELADDPVLHDHNSVPQRDPDPSFWGQDTDLFVVAHNGQEIFGPENNWDDVKEIVHGSETLDWDVLEYVKGKDVLVAIYVTRPVFLRLTNKEFKENKEMFHGIRKVATG